MIQKPSKIRLLEAVLTKNSLGPTQIKDLLSSVGDGNSGANLFETYLLVLDRRGVTSREVRSLVDLLLKRAKRIQAGMPFIDVCGTGGDQSHTFNISTVTAFIVAAGGVPVLKHGNRSVSSRCGSSDLLEAAGICLEKAAKRAQSTLKALRFGYLHAPLFHPFFGSVAPLRRRIGRPTVLNFLGPLLHPAKPRRQLVGIGDQKAFEQYGGWLKGAGLKSALVVRGEGGLDEATPYGVTQVLELKGGRILKSKIRARDFGFRARKLKELTVSGPRENLSCFQGLLAGKERGSKREAVLLNAGLAFLLAKRAANLREGIRLAGEVTDSGAAGRLLKEYVRITR